MTNFIINNFILMTVSKNWNIGYCWVMLTLSLLFGVGPYTIIEISNFRLYGVLSHSELDGKWPDNLNPSYLNIFLRIPAVTPKLLSDLNLH